MINIQKFYTVHFNYIQSTLVLLHLLWSTTFIVNFWLKERETILLTKIVNQCLTIIVRLCLTNTVKLCLTKIVMSNSSNIISPIGLLLYEFY